jgi:2-polyprenyl-3-methyl-5-hydroxy-6-metoxy-1,4-benzoquinol methylase
MDLELLLSVIGSTPDHGPAVRQALGTLLARQDLLLSSGAYMPVRSFDDEPEQTIDVEADQEALAALWQQVQPSWSRFGEVDPDWSVASEERFRTTLFEQNAEQFYRTGQVDVERFQGWLRRNHIDASHLRTCLDFGCGTGRLARWLAGGFERVVACDFSPTHIQLASRRLRDLGLRNIDWRLLTSFSDLSHLAPVDAFVSIMVLQHDPPPLIGFLLRLLFRALNPRGIAFFQVPTFRRGYGFDLRLHLSRPPDAGAMQMHVFPQREVFRIAAEEGMQPLEVLPDNYVSEPDGVSTTFLFQRTPC